MYIVDETPGARVALITFGSFTNPGRSEPSYAFMNTVLRMKRKRGLSFDAYYFKARANDWYFSGTEGQPSLEHSVDIVSAVRNKYDEALFLGNSMGAYGALLFGLAVSATAVLAFSPQTRFDEPFCRNIGERRWRDEFAAMAADRDVEIMSIRNRWPEDCRTKVGVFAGELNQQDLAYCLDLQGLPGFTLHRYADSGHDLVHDLRATGALEEIILKELMSTNDKISAQA